jgi:hypothetical protein
MYKLNTYAGRLKALSDNHTLAIHTEFNGVLYVNLHTLPAYIHMIKRIEFACTIKQRTAVSAAEFNAACRAIGFEGVVRDELHAALFGTVSTETSSDTEETLATTPEPTQALKELMLHQRAEKQAIEEEKRRLFMKAQEMGGKPC